jgi:hypothetical protein
MATRADDRSLGELMAELTGEIGTLVRKEIELATTELSAKASDAGRHVAVAAAGGALVHAGLLVLLAAVVVALSQAGLQPWVAALVVAALTIAVGYALVATSVSRLKRARFAPRNTIESIKETARWTTGQNA